mmetsp:Transcript_20105/g.32566  ORF Transcript_20105/g.32566 Transcript_20105/m.32566 type:complete len:206 (-) Transcript_20105:450-1067(-)
MEGSIRESTIERKHGTHNGRPNKQYTEQEELTSQAPPDEERTTTTTQIQLLRRFHDLHSAVILRRVHLHADSKENIQKDHLHASSQAFQKIEIVSTQGCQHSGRRADRRGEGEVRCPGRRNGGHRTRRLPIASRACFGRQLGRSHHLRHPRASCRKGDGLQNVRLGHYRGGSDERRRGHFRRGPNESCRTPGRQDPGRTRTQERF